MFKKILNSKITLVAQLILFSGLVFNSFSSHARGYAGLYGIAMDSDVNKTEAGYEKNKAAVAIGFRENGLFGELYLLDQTGIGGSIGLSRAFGWLRLSAGVTAISDKSTGKVNGKLSESKDNALGFVVGVDVSMFSLRFIQYDADHSYNDNVKTGYTDKGDPIYKTVATTTGSSKRNVIMAGFSTRF